MRSEEGNTNNSSRNRVPTWTERETNRRRERRRRAIASKIYAGLRAHGNYKLQRHCDNNEVLKALCEEAGWTAEDDGTTYRKGCKPAKHVDVVGCSASASPCSSYQPSPFASYNPSPSSSSFPNPKRSRNISIDGAGDDSLLPWLKNFSSGAANPPNHNNLYMEHYGSISAPVTPPLCSSPSRSPCIKTNREAMGCTFVHSSSTPISAPVTPPLSSSPSWSLMRTSREATGCTFLSSSSMPSPDHQVFPDSSLLSGVCTPNGVPTSPTFSLISSNKSNPFGSARMWTPGHIGLCLPVVPGGRAHVDVQMASGVCDEFAFGSTSNGTGLLKAWEGERIHGECAPDELELTLGTSKISPDA